MILIDYNSNINDMSLAYNDKENQYLHDVQISPERNRRGPRHLNILASVQDSKAGNEISLFPIRKRKQLEELWLQPVPTLDTSLEEIVSDEPSSHSGCSCLKEHLL